MDMHRGSVTGAWVSRAIAAAWLPVRAVKRRKSSAGRAVSAGRGEDVNG